MKTAMMVAAAALCGTVMAVESNVVGYQNLELKNKYNLIALSFQSLEGGSIDIQNLFDGASLTAGLNNAEADQIQIWNGTSFKTYWYRKSNPDGKGPAKFTYDDCWVDFDDNKVPAVKPLDVALGMWFIRVGNDTKTVAISGQVKATPNDLTISAGYNMMGSAFPVDIYLNAADCPFDWAAQSQAGLNNAEADQIQIWNGEAFNTYWYRKSNPEGKGPAKFTYDDCWVDFNDNKTPWPGKISAGNGVWYIKPTGSDDATLTQKSPLAPAVAE